MILKDVNNTYICHNYFSSTGARQFVLGELPDAPLSGMVRLVSDYDEELVSFEAGDYQHQHITGDDPVWQIEFTNAEPVVPPEPSLEELRARKVEEINVAANDAITSGVTVMTTYGEEHFRLTADDQANLTNISLMLAAGRITAYPYHADGKTCMLYSGEDLARICNASIAHATYHTTYCNLLKVWVNREDDEGVVQGIYYGAELPEDLREWMGSLLTAAQGGGDGVG